MIKYVIEITPDDTRRLRKTVDAMITRVAKAQKSSDGSVRKWANDHIDNLHELRKLLGGR